MPLKRFYKKAEAGTAPGGYTVRLDGKNIKTPLQHALIVPTATMAAAMAAEWDAQVDDVHPSSMPLNQLVNTMLDKATGYERPAMNAEIVKYAGSDLVCYFALHPADLVARQETLWHPLINWIFDEHGVVLKTVQGIQYINQPDESMHTVKKLTEALSPADFTVVQAVTGLTGSAVIAFAVAAGRLGAQQAYDAAVVDEAYQLEKWGEDQIARDKLSRLLLELETIEKFRFLMNETA